MHSTLLTHSFIAPSPPQNGTLGRADDGALGGPDFSRSLKVSPSVPPVVVLNAESPVEIMYNTFLHFLFFLSSARDVRRRNLRRRNLRRNLLSWKCYLWNPWWSERFQVNGQMSNCPRYTARRLQYVQSITKIVPRHCSQRWSA
jgi:hypothetical protein